MPHSRAATAAEAVPIQVTYETMANTIRALSMDAIERAKSGHPGMPMGVADVATVLFSRFLKFDASCPTWPDRDRFVLSAGHGSMLLYSLLYLTGYSEITIDEIKRFRQLGSRTPGHPEVDPACGIEVTTGPLGQGISAAVGMALAERIVNARFGDELVDHRTYVLASDGDLMEGISHEACALAGHLRLHKLTVLYDANNRSIDGPTSLADSENVLLRFRAYGWHTLDVDGHNAAEIEAALAEAKESDRPTLIRCRTTIGYGSPSKAGKASSHGAPLGPEEVEGARQQLDWPHEPFEVPAPILETWRAIGREGIPARQAWEARLRAADPQTREAFRAALAAELPDDLDDLIATYKREVSAEQPKLATRQASAEVLELLVPAIPTLMGGSCDLTSSNGTKTKIASEAIRSDAFGGRYIHYGVREHAMGAIMNGLTLHGGVLPYGGTFLAFADYCRPAIRLAALMRLQSIFVMTHDSIGVGEDGPTHQPVEHLATLRAIPNLLMLRPADAVETAECWEIALRSRTRPSVLVLTRQGFNTQRTEHVDENLSQRGAYVFKEAVAPHQVTLIATGSEVAIAAAAREQLEDEGIGTRVVSMPCWELFDEQDSGYKRSVIADGTLKIAVEAAIRHGWDRHIGPDGIFVGMTGFGASAPYLDLYRHFGITAEAIVAAAKKRLG